MPPPPGRDPRYELLDAWRGAACLMVIVHHAGFAIRPGDPAGPSTWGWARRALLAVVRNLDLGVPLFFVISGYCIAASVDAHRRRGSSSWGFLARRARRIYPPYWAALLVFAATTWGLDAAGLGRLHRGGYSLELASPGSLSTAQWLGNLTLTETWRPRAWGGGQPEVYTRVAWSLCFEEQFYLVCFLTLAVAPRRLLPALGAATAAIVGFRVFAWDSGWIVRYRGMFPELWHEFAVGLGVYWRLALAPPGRARLAVDAALVGLLAVGLGWSYPSTAAAAAFGLVLIATRRLDAAAAGQAWLSPLRACGRRCYSLYLIHLPVCTVGSEWLVGLGLADFRSRVLVVVPLVTLASIGAGWAFFAAVESRFLNPPSDRKPHPRPLAGEAEPGPAVAGVG